MQKLVGKVELMLTFRSGIFKGMIRTGAMECLIGRKDYFNRTRFTMVTVPKIRLERRQHQQ